MHILVGILRVLLLGCSCCGYILHLSKKIKTEFTIGVLFNSICCVMFLMGILNVMQEAAWGIFLLGLYFLIISSNKGASVYKLLCPGTAFFFASGVVLFASLKGCTFFEYDDFSHWGTVLKVIIEKDGFPNFSDTVISFQSYPLGSAAFIYYFVCITGISSEWFQLFIQAIYMAGVLTSLFAFVKGWIGNLFAAAFSAVLLVCITGLEDLSVDTLLSVTAVGAVLFCYYYKDQLCDYICYIIPYTIALVTIKNSGILFMMGTVFFGIYYVRKSGIVRWKWGYTALCPWLTLFLWQRHVLQVFENGLSSKHTMTGDHIFNMFLEKEQEDINTVITAFVDKILSFDNEFLWFLLLIVLLLLISKKFSTDGKELEFLSGFIVGFYVVYQIGLLGMYITTMPIGEAARLACYSRYHRTALVFCAGLLYLMITRIAADASLAERKKTVFVTYGISALLIFCTLFPGLWYNNYKYRVPVRSDFQQLIEQNGVKPNQSYFIVVDSELASVYSGYLKCVARYLLNSSKVYVCDMDAYSIREKGWSGYDYLIVLSESEEVISFLVKMGLPTDIRIFEAQ